MPGEDRVRATAKMMQIQVTGGPSKCVHCAISKIKQKNINKKLPYHLFYNKHPAFLKHLRTFGEIGIVADHANKKIRGKLEDRGFPCMFVGYTTNHAGNVYVTKFTCPSANPNLNYLSRIASFGK